MRWLGWDVGWDFKMIKWDNNLQLSSFIYHISHISHHRVGIHNWEWDWICKNSCEGWIESWWYRFVDDIGLLMKKRNERWERYDSFLISLFMFCLGSNHISYHLFFHLIAPRLSFFFGIGMNCFMEISKLRWDDWRW